jgi:hypothetical protein
VVCRSRSYDYVRTLSTVTAKSHARDPTAATLLDLVDGAISRGGETGRTAGALRSQFHGPVSGQCPRQPASKRWARMRAGSSKYRGHSRNSGENPLRSTRHLEHKTKRPRLDLSLGTYVDQPSPKCCSRRIIDAVEKVENGTRVLSPGTDGWESIHPSRV